MDTKEIIFFLEDINWDNDKLKQLEDIIPEVEEVTQIHTILNKFQWDDGRMKALKLLVNCNNFKINDIGLLELVKIMQWDDGVITVTKIVEPFLKRVKYPLLIQILKTIQWDDGKNKLLNVLEEKIDVVPSITQVGQDLKKLYEHSFTSALTLLAELVEDFDHNTINIPSQTSEKTSVEDVTTEELMGMLEGRDIEDELTDDEECQCKLCNLRKENTMLTCGDIVCVQCAKELVLGQQCPFCSEEFYTLEPF